MKIPAITRTISIGFAILLGFYAITATAEESSDQLSLLTGTWEGPLTLNSDDEMTLALTFSASEGKYTAVLTSAGMGIYGMPVDFLRVRGLSLTVRVQRLDLEILGTLRMDESEEKVQLIDASWFQGSEMVPLKLLAVDTASN